MKLKPETHNGNDPSEIKRQYEEALLFCNTLSKQVFSLPRFYEALGAILANSQVNCQSTEPSCYLGSSFLSLYWVAQTQGQGHYTGSV